ncbi:MAG: OmpA family protein [Bacteroidia bacterium]|nr:OmpA family protein [Bacteroidia bacterium]
MRIELSHDLIGKQVYARLSADEKAIRKAARMLKDSYELHTSLSEGGKSRLLNREELIFLSSYIKDIQPGPKMVAYLEESEEAVQEAEEAEKKRLKDEIALRNKQRRTARNFNILLGVTILGLVLFGSYVLYPEIDKIRQARDVAEAKKDSIQQVEVEIGKALKNEITKKDSLVEEALEVALGPDKVISASARNIPKLQSLKGRLEARLESLNSEGIRYRWGWTDKKELQLISHIFSKANPNLNPEQTAYFKNIMEVVKKDSINNYEIDLEVHTNSAGDYSVNGGVSLERAAQVARVLLESLKEDKNTELNIYSKGESEPFNGNPNDDRRTVLNFSIRE